MERKSTVEANYSLLTMNDGLRVDCPTFDLEFEFNFWKSFRKVQEDLSKQLSSLIALSAIFGMLQRTAGK
jgi:hypothetical protein